MARRRPSARLLTPAGWAGLVVLAAAIAGLVGLAMVAGLGSGGR